MDQKTLAIVKAGWAMFARYGYAKTTMSDIAGEAGVARQTVYNAFASKEDILRAVMRHAGELSLSEIEAEWEKDLSLAEKLEVFQRLGPQSWYEAILAAPDWGELMDGMNKIGAEELRIMEEKWIASITRLLNRHRDDVSATLPLQEVATFFYTSSKNAKYGVNGVDELRARLATIHQATLALLQI